MKGVSIRITFAKWLPMGIVIVGAILFAYVGLQQLNRAQLNDPQIQMAEDAATALAAGAEPGSVVPTTLVDAGQSLAPWIAVYKGDGTPVSGNVVLNGAPAAPPAGVFTSALSKGEDRVTWQPEGGVRIALVVVPVPNSNGLYVAAGRSMREGEAQMDEIGALAVGAIILLLIITFGLELFGAWRHAQAMAAMAKQQGTNNAQPSAGQASH